MVSWHRSAFRLFWRWRSRASKLGRLKVGEEVRHLIRRMKSENPTWGAPRIHGELLQVGFEISEPTVSRYLHRLMRRTGSKKAKSLTHLVLDGPLAVLSLVRPGGNRISFEMRRELREAFRQVAESDARALLVS